MSWRAWILLSLAWETSLSLVSAMAVKKGHRVSILDVDGVSAQQPNCGTCDLADRDDTSLYDQCNFWGDPHVTRRFGPLGARDYQGGGVQNVTRTTDDCNQLEMQAFHCQYKNSQNNVMLGALVQITVDGTVVKVYIKPTPSGLSVDVSPPSVVTVIVRSDNKAVTISSPDGCLYIFIDLKTISVAPLYILNMKSRVLKDLPIIGPDGGYCGAQPADTATVTDNSTWLFTESQVLELCDLCSAGGAQIIPPGCPGATPPAGDPVGLPRCSFADAIVARDDNIVEFECTGTIQDRINLIDQGDTLVLTDNDCAFGYTANSVNADRLSCSAICNLIAPGSTCKGTLNGDEKCLGTNFDEGECDAANNDGACLCGNIPDSLAQQEGPTVDQLLDLNGVDDDDLDRAAELERVIKICTSDGTNFLTGTPYPPANPNDPLTENQFILEGCIKDVLSLGPNPEDGDVDEVVDNTEDFDPDQPSGDTGPAPCTPADGTTALDSNCTCTATEVCTAGQACDSSSGCSDADCRTFTCPGDRPAITPVQPCNGGCSDTQCCVPTCESHTCTQDGFVPNETAKTEVCTGQACGDGQCCVPTCESHTCTQDGFVPNEAAKTEVCTGQACGDGQCCEPTCESHTCTQDGFVPNETAKTEVCTGQECGDGQCCQPTCSSFDCPANFVKNLPKNPELCPNGMCDKVFCCEPTCGSYVECAQDGFVPDDSKNEVVCSGGTCDDATCCQPTCLSYEKCTQQGFVKDSAKDSKKCLPGGCDDITCCEATCATYKHCMGRRNEPDPKKATKVCGLTANKCNDDLCCEKRGQLRRNERQEHRGGGRHGHYGHYAYEPGAAKLIDTEELAFLQESNFVDEDEEDEEESEEL